MKRQLLTSLLGIPEDALSGLGKSDDCDLVDVARLLIKNGRPDLLAGFRSQPVLDGTLSISAAAITLGIERKTIVEWCELADNPLVSVPSPIGLTVFKNMLIECLKQNDKEDLVEKLGDE